jgi:hypothetical protein
LINTNAGMKFNGAIKIRNVIEVDLNEVFGILVICDYRYPVILPQKHIDTKIHEKNKKLIMERRINQKAYSSDSS